MTLYGFDGSSRAWTEVVCSPYDQISAAEGSPLVALRFAGDLTDSSGNGRAGSVTSGTMRYTTAGQRTCGWLSSCTVSVTDAALQLTGAVSLVWLGLPLVAQGDATHNLLSCGALGDTEAANTLYALLTASGLVWRSESGAGVDATLSSGRYLSAGNFICVGGTRSSGGNVKIFVDGSKLADGSLTLPTGGNNAALTVGAWPDTGGPHPAFVAFAAVYGSELSESAMISLTAGGLGLL